MAKKNTLEEKSNGDATKNTLNALLKGYSGTHFNHLETKSVRIPSGSLLLDTYIKIKSGMVLRLGGSAEVGKSSQAMLYAQNYMDTMPNSKTIYVSAEAKFSEEFQSRTGMKYVENAESWESGTVFVFKTNNFNTICNTLRSLLKTAHEQEEHLCIIIDSVDMLRLAGSDEKDIGESKKPAGVNWLTKEMFRQIGQEIQAYNSLLIMITQYSATFSLDPYSKEPPQIMEGNNTHALNHQVSYAFYYRNRNRKDYILQDDNSPPHPVTNKIIGVKAKIDIRKSATDQTGITIEIPIKKGRVGNSIWIEKEVADLILGFGLAIKKGAWISFDEGIIKKAKEDNVELKPQIQGLENFYQYFEKETAVFQWFLKEIKTVIQ